MSTELYMCEFCAEDFEAMPDDVLYGDDRDGEGLTVYFCCLAHQFRYERGEGA